MLVDDVGIVVVLLAPPPPPGRPAPPPPPHVARAARSLAQANSPAMRAARDAISELPYQSFFAYLAEARPAAPALLARHATKDSLVKVLVFAVLSMSVAL